MSHFSLAVITASRPTKDDLARILQPWHEYECTGIMDQYVIWEDHTDEVRKEWSGETKVKYREDAKLSLQEEYGSISQFARDWHGYDVHDGQIGRWTNPNSKWDWWQIGGRWTGHLKPEYDPNTDPKNIERCDLCHGTGKRTDMVVANGCNGCEGKGRRVKWPTQWRDFEGDQCQISELSDGIEPTFAVVKEGQWYERGQMGWFAMVSDEQDESDWNAEFQKLMQSLPGDHWITIVDCHV